jgi:hypothetical protein
MAREILSKRNFLDFESPDSAISRSPMTLIKSIVSLNEIIFHMVVKIIENLLVSLAEEYLKN